MEFNNNAPMVQLAQAFVDMKSPTSHNYGMGMNGNEMFMLNSSQLDASNILSQNSML